MPRMEYQCLECGKIGETYPSQSRKFCSMACAGKYHARPGMPTKPRRGKTLACGTCGAEVYRPESGIPKSGQVFCSVGCHNAYQGRNAHERQCEVCGGTFRLATSALRYQPGRFCSKECEGRSRMKRVQDREHNGRPAVEDNHGYIRIYQPDHPKAMNGGWMFEHRWLVEQQLGRFLSSDEHVHHVNGMKNDNRLENLQLLSAQEHRVLTAQEIKQQRADVKAQLAEYIRRYGPLD